MKLQLALALPLLALALSGCSDGGASGEVSATSTGLAALVADGYSNTTYQAFSNPLASPVPPPDGVENPTECFQNQIPDFPAEQQCTFAYSDFDVHFMSLPDPDANLGYTVFLVNATGELQLGSLENVGGMWGRDFNVTDEDFAARFSGLELRMGDFVLGVASVTAGQQAFALAEGLASISATGEYSGKTLTLTVSGLPANATYTGYLYEEDENGVLQRTESFPVQNGPVEHEAPQSISGYREFHIHVAGSMINLFKATIE
ncbi:MAG TPA: hypothetical protein VI796_01415 [Candidatus Thermoplasmatota archaeon]|nr:hypothetical protein [Candidatus Thermoplasmatota archaeon]